MKINKNNTTKEISPNSNTDINLPSQDIKTEEGQPTFKQALKVILENPSPKQNPKTANKKNKQKK